MNRKKSLLLILGSVLIAAVAYATSVVYSGNLVNNPGAAYSQVFVLNLKNGGQNQRTIDNLTATAAYSSATITAPSFTDGGVAMGTFTVTSNSGLVAVAATQTITVASTSSLKNAILVANGVGLRQGYGWIAGTDTTTTAASLAALLTKVTGLDAASSGAIVTATATTAGTAGNSIALSKISAGNLTLGGTTLSGGVDPASITIGNQVLKAGTNFAIGGTAALTAGNIATAIRANSILNALVSVSTDSSAHVILTARSVGVAGNLAIASFPSSITNTGSAMAGGTDSAYTINTSIIHKTAHGLTTALPVLYSTGSAFPITGLTNQTTYYAAPIDADNFRLSNTSTGAVAGVGFQVLTSSSVVGPHTFTLTPLTISGTFGFKWQVSNDNSTWFDLATSSVTFASPYTGTQTAWVFGAMPYHYVRANFSAGTAGAMNLVISLYGTNNN